MSDGANNVYCFPGITKRNRSGCIFLIDIHPDKEHELSHYLAEHLGIYGYHRIQTAHYCAQCQIQAHTVIVREGDNAFETEIRWKKTEGSTMPGRVEHSDAVKLCKQVRRELDISIPLVTIKARLQAAVQSGAENPITINL
jgi:hypothetical protein